jgi:stress response protein SCP2
MEAESSSAPGYRMQSNEKRKAGVKLQKNQTSSVPKARLDLDLDFQQEDDLDAERLEETIKKAYGGRARVTIDEVADKDEASRRQSRRSEGRRWQNVKCRVMFDDAEEAKTWQQRGTASRAVQSSISTALKLDSGAVEFDSETKVGEVDAITLKLDSDSSQILCGACLLYSGQGECEKIVHYSDRCFACGAVRHSGDTQVDGKSVHTISIVQSKIPADVNHIYFTLCSCGPEDLSGFKNPSIMLFDNNQPDANLLEYSINQAAKSLSCVMARMLRQPSWSQGDRTIIARLLRRVKFPLLCIDLVMAMAAESTWAVQALGTEEWNLTAKICCHYEACTALIERHIQSSNISGKAL